MKIKQLINLSFSILFLNTFSLVSSTEKKEETKEVKREERKNLLETCLGDNKFIVNIKNRTEAFYGKSTRLLSGSSLDQVVYPQTTWDITSYGELDKGVKAQVVMRNKSRWGNPNSIAQTTESTLKIADAEVGAHKHFIGRQIMWIREGWVEILLNKAFDFPGKKEHTLKLGVFPFELGRGIALGSAYAVSPGLIGFFNSNIIDQFAPGALLHGTIHDNSNSKVYYDFYVGVLENKSDSFDNITQKIYAQEIGRRKDPFRGFGSINYIVASKVDWVVSSICGEDKLVIEPYGFYNRDPEQRVEFPSDASSKLITVGIYGDYVHKKFEFGFDCAVNFGGQCVKPWDRNQIQIENREGFLVEDYSQVFQGEPKNKDKALVTEKNKEIVNNSEQSPELNGKEIGNTGLFNGNNRFRKGYENKYQGGFMFVADASYKLDDNWQLATTFGLATGDENPNRNLRNPLDSEVDGNFSGFIGLQEVYSGKRVKSLFIIGANKLVRPLSFPDNTIPQIERFASDTPGFSNLIYTGLGLTWKYKSCSNKEVSITPTILGYWQEHPTKKFSLKEKRTIDALANSHLGTELSLWFDAKVLKSLKAFFISGIFIPGRHYDDIKGKPLNADQLKLLDQIKNATNALLLGNHVAYVLNFGFEYYF